MMSRLLAFLRYFLGVLFVATGIGKLLDNRGFAVVIASYQLGIPDGWLLAVGLAVSLLELVIGVNILRGRSLTSNVLATLAFHLGYMGLALITLQRGIEISNCGCFGVFWARPLTAMTVVEDAALAGISLVTWLWLRKATSLTQQ